MSISESFICHMTLLVMEMEAFASSAGLVLTLSPLSYVRQQAF